MTDIDFKKYHMSETERERIHKMIREGLSNQIIKARTGRSDAIIRKERRAIEGMAHHPLTGE